MAVFLSFFFVVKVLFFWLNYQQFKFKFHKNQNSTSSMAYLLLSTVLRLERKSTLAAAPLFLILLNLESVLETFLSVGLTLKF